MDGYSANNQMQGCTSTSEYGVSGGMGWGAAIVVIIIIIIIIIIIWWAASAGNNKCNCGRNDCNKCGNKYNN